MATHTGWGDREDLTKTREWPGGIKKRASWCKRHSSFPLPRISACLHVRPHWPAGQNILWFHLLRLDSGSSGSRPLNLDPLLSLSKLWNIETGVGRQTSSPLTSPPENWLWAKKYMSCSTVWLCPLFIKFDDTCFFLAFFKLPYKRKVRSAWTWWCL